MKPALVFALLLVIPSCGSKPQVQNSPPPTPIAQQPGEPCRGGFGQEMPCDALQQALSDEMSNYEKDSLRLRLQARQRVIDYLKTEHPKWQLNGMSLTRYDSDPGYYVAIDVTDEGKSKLVPLKVWYLVKSNGESYWKVGAP